MSDKDITVEKSNSESSKTKSKLSIAAGGAATALAVSGQAFAAPCLSIEVTSGLDNYASPPVGSLRAAIDDTEVAGDCDGENMHTITFSSSVNLIELDGELDIDSSNVYLKGPGADSLTISPSSSPGGSTPRINVDGRDIKISGLALSDFQTSAVRSYSGDVELDSVKIEDASSSDRGAGLRADGSSGDVVITNSVFDGNSANNDGGAVSAYNRINVSISNSSFSENDTTESSSYHGGALYIRNAETVAISNSSFDGNSSADYSRGAGAYIYGDYDTDSITIENTTFSNNSMSYGGTGAGLFLKAYNANVTISNSTLSNNDAGSLGYGGGLYVNAGSADINSSTIVENTAYAGGGIQQEFNSVTLNHTIVADNNASFNPDVEGSFDLENSILGDTSGASIGTQSNSQTGVSSEDLNLGALAYNGGFGKTHIPQSGSVAIDAGATSSALTTDQLGNARVSGSGQDIGSVEVQPNGTAGVIPEVVAEAAKKKKSSGSLGILVGMLGFLGIRRKLK